MNRPFRVILLGATVALVSASCSSPDGSKPDSGRGGSGGSAPDAAQDVAAVDVAVETPDVDAAPDSPVPDTAPEASVDIAPEAAVDVAPEASADVAPEGSVDVGPEGPVVDSSVDEPVDAGPHAPRIMAVKPATVFRGDEFFVVGTDFEPTPRARLANVVLAPTQMSAAALSFRVPADFPLRTCEEQMSLVVETEAGLSAPQSMVVRDPGPTLTSPPSSIPAGTVLALDGCNLTSVQITLNSRVLSPQATTATRVSLAIPRDVPAGAATLSISNGRGQSTFQITVLPPTPQIVTTDLKTVGLGGILFITTDATNKALIDSVRVGSTTIPVSSATDFKWTDQGSTPAASLIAVRIPTTIALGNVNIALAGSSGISDLVSVTVVSPPPATPPATGAIVIPPGTAGAADDTFPIGTTEPFVLADPGATPALADVDWSYVLHVHEANESACSGMGTIDGDERRRVRPMDQTPGKLCGTNWYCCPIAGTYVINGTSNQVKMTIDRRPSGGIVEDYEGGWVQADGTSAPAGVGFRYLVLRSKITGIQMSIRHRWRQGCHY